MNLLELLRRRPSENEIKWQEGRSFTYKVGGIDILERKMSELRAGGDSTAVVVEHRSEANPDQYNVRLRYDLRKKGMLDDTNTWWDSKGVGIWIQPSGEMQVGFTWRSRGVNHWRFLGDITDINDVLTGEKIQEFFEQASTLEEKIEFAMGIAKMYQDYRFGEGIESLNQKPVKSNTSKRVF